MKYKRLKLGKDLNHTNNQTHANKCIYEILFYHEISEE